MKKYPFVAIGLSLLALCFFATCVSAQDTLSARQVIEKNIEAQGGRTVLQNIQTVYSEYKTTMEGRDVNFVIKEMLPNKGSFEIVYQGRVVYKSVFDGSQGYELEDGKMVPEKPEAFKDKFYKKNIFNELDFLDTSLYAIELIGEGKVGREVAYIIKTTLKNGAEKNIYYSKKTFLELKSERTKLKEIERSDVSLCEKYTRHGDVIYADLLRVNVGTQTEKKMALVSLRWNEGVTDADFRQ